MIHFFCALRCEAVPLIDYYELRHLKESQLFNIYVNKDKNISLTITGIGKLAATAGVIYSYSMLDCKPNDIWLNIGVAGHRDHAVGDIYLCNRIEDSASKKVWYPQIVIKCDIPSDNLLTLDLPSIEYSEAMFDMEASGFISATSRFATAELTHSIKIISDNQECPTKKLSESAVKKLIELNKNKIIGLTLQFETLSSELDPDIDISSEISLFMNQWHFTQYQRIHLEQLLRRWHILLPDSPALLSIGDSGEDANSVLDFLTNIMNDTGFFLDPAKPDV